MYTVTWINGSTLGAVPTPSAGYAATLFYALRAYGMHVRVWHGGKIVSPK